MMMMMMMMMMKYRTLHYLNITYRRTYVTSAPNRVCSVQRHYDVRVCLY